MRVSGPRPAPDTQKTGDATGQTDSRSSILWLLVKPFLSDTRTTSHSKTHWLSDMEGGKEIRIRL